MGSIFGWWESSTCPSLITTTEVPLSAALNPNLLQWSCSVASGSGHLPGINVYNAMYVSQWDQCSWKTELPVILFWINIGRKKLCMHSGLGFNPTPGVTGWISRIQKKVKISKRGSVETFLRHVPFIRIFPSLWQPHVSSCFSVSITLTSSQLIVIPRLPSSVFCSTAPFSFLFFPSIACVLSSVDVIIWAFVFVWQVSRAFYLRHFHSIFTTQTHKHRQTHTHRRSQTHMHIHT